MTQVRFTRKGIVLLFFVLLLIGGIGTYVVVRLNQANEASKATEICADGNWVTDDSHGWCDDNGHGCRTKICEGGVDDGETSDNCGFCTGENQDCQEQGNQFQCVNTDPGNCVAPCPFIQSSGTTSAIEVTWYCEDGYDCTVVGGTCAQRCEGGEYKYIENGVVKHSPNLAYPEFCYNKQKDYYSTGGATNPDWNSFVGHSMSRRQHEITDPECQPVTLNNPPLCRSLVVTGGIGTGQNRVVTETEDISLTATGYDPDGPIKRIGVCYTIAGQAATFYTNTTPVNPWICQTGDLAIPGTVTINPNIIPVANGYSFRVPSDATHLTFANMRAAIRARVTTLTDAQINAAGIQFATNIHDNATGPYCSTNIGYRNGAGVLIPDGTTACDGDTCVAKITLAPPVTNKPACKSLTLTGGTLTGTTRIVTATEAITATVVGADPDGAPAKIGICYALAGQPTAFYQTTVLATNPANPWTCLESTALTSVANGYSAVFTGLNYTAMRTAIMAKTPAHTQAQVDAAGVQIISRIFDNADNTECNTNIGYNNGAGIIWPGGTTTCDGDSCLAKIAIQAVPEPKTCFQTGCIAAGGCTGAGITCDQTLDKCVNAACVTSATCVCPQNPNWDVTKTPTIACVDDSMQTSTARVTYNLDVVYTNPGGTSNGTLNTVVDRPVGIRMEWIDLAAYNPAGGVATESTVNPGFVDNITWTLTGALATFTPAQTKRFTYVVAIPAGANGINYKTYTNIVSIYGTASTPLDTATASTPVSCVPGTGLFDEVWVRIALGVILFAGGVVYLSYEGSNNVISRAYVNTQAMLFKDAQVRLSQSSLEEKVLSRKTKSKK